MKKTMIACLLLISVACFGQSMDSYTELTLIDQLTVNIHNKQTISTGYNVEYQDGSHQLIPTIGAGTDYLIGLEKCGIVKVKPTGNDFHSIVEPVWVEINSCMEVLASGPSGLRANQTRDGLHIIFNAPYNPAVKKIVVYVSSTRDGKDAVPIAEFPATVKENYNITIKQ